MEDFEKILESVIKLLTIEFNVYGFSISFWQIFLFSIVAGFVGSALYKLFGGE